MLKFVNVLHALSFVLLCVGVSTQTLPGCNRVGGFCWTHQSKCPEGYKKDERYSNFYGCRRPDRQCCVVDEYYGTGARSRDVCGKGSLNTVDRILDGTLTGTCDWPFVVSIRGRNSMDGPLTYENSSHACAGVLIDTQWVLTSPFCVLTAGLSLQDVRERVLVVAGEYNVSDRDLDPVTGQPQEQVINVDAAFFEPRYPFTSQFDAVPFLQDAKAINSYAVALLHLKEPITGSCSGVACLPTNEEAANECANHEQCVILGWGYNRADFDGLDDSLLQGNVQLTSRAACNFLATRLDIESFRPNGTICQSPRDRNTDSCLGDEGGPVLCAKGNNWVVRGVLPFNLCSSDNFNVFVTEVATYLDWILDTMANLTF